MSLSDWLGVAGLVLFGLGGMLISLARLNDVDEPLLPRSFDKWKHIRVGFPYFVAAAVVLASAGTARLTGN